MGALVEQQIKSFFQGVSRQPDSFRSPGQIEDGLNLQFSVERGGFTHRAPSRHVKLLSGLSGSIAFHTIDRDPTERYCVVIKNGTIRVVTADGDERAVNVIGSAGSYISGDEKNLSCISVADYTFIVNRSKVVKMDETKLSPAQENKAVIFVYYGVTTGSYNVIINGASVASVTGVVDTQALTTNIATAMRNSLGSNWTVDTEGSYIFVYRKDGADFTIKTSDPYSDKGLKLCYKAVVASADLPLKAPEGLLVRVGAESVGQYYVKSERLTNGGSDVRWLEACAPGEKIAFDASTMPHALVRTADGSFELKEVDWEVKEAGTEDTMPTPDFVGNTIRDIVFHRNRLGFLSDETTFYSAAGDYFRFWRQKTTEQLDDDPFSMTASTNKVSILEWAIPFRKAMIVMSDNAQFEISGELLTAKKATIDLSTSYTVTNRCRPISAGDSLYFAAANGKDAVILEYIYDDNSVSNTAVESTKHVKGYIPSTVEHMTSDAVSNNMFIVSSGAPDTVYTYTYFWNGDDKAQQAWGRWNFNGDIIRGISCLGGYLYVVVERIDGLSIERVSFGGEDFANFDFIPRVDRSTLVKGTFDGYRTHWTLPYKAEAGIQGITDNQFTNPAKRIVPLRLDIEGDNEVSIVGDWSESEVCFGYPYLARAELSKIYYRGPDEAAIITGRLQLRYMTLLYEESGYFRVVVTPSEREPNVYEFTGRILGSALNRASYTPISSGAFKFPVQSRGDTVKIAIENDTYIPFTITSAAWTGFFNEISRQES